MISFALGLLAGILVGVFLYGAWLSFMFARGRIPAGWQNIVVLAPGFKERIKKAGRR